MGDRLGTPGAFSNLFFFLKFFFLLLSFSSKPLQWRVIFFCTFRLFCLSDAGHFFAVSVSALASAFFFFFFSSSFSFSIVFKKIKKYQFQFNLRTTADLTDTVAFGKLPSVKFYSLVLFTFHLFCFARQRLSWVSQYGYHHAVTVESANEQKTVNSVTCESVITPCSASVCSVCSAQHIFQLII